jgi:hypothetical protein
MSLVLRSRIVEDRAMEAAERLGRGLPGALRRGLLRLGFSLGRRIAQNIEGGKKCPPGTRALSRAYLQPHVEGTSVVLGLNAPVYAGVQEFGGTIRARSAPYLVFQTCDGEWHTVSEVTIPPKHFLSEAVAEVEAIDEAQRILGLEIEREFAGSA